jgi:hypothetical protein
MNLRQSMPLAITDCHGLLTNSLENKDFASNKCRMFSARLAAIYHNYFWVIDYIDILMFTW